jgi:hypothetical protein
MQDDDYDDDDLIIEVNPDGTARAKATKQTLLVLQRKAESLGMTVEEYIGQCLQQKLIRDSYSLLNAGSTRISTKH